jgi:Protein of unknown function (DUF2510)
MTYNPPFAATPANWYADPADPAQERYWDGAEWTAQVRPAAAVPTAYTAAPPLPPYYPAPQARPGNRYSFAAMVLGVIAFLFVPILFGPIGLIVGYIGKTKGEAKAGLGMAVAGIGMVAGMIAGALLAAGTL